MSKPRARAAPKRTYTLTARADGMVQARERIARAGLELWLERAYEDVTLAAIATAAGVSHQTVLNHFGSKEGVALAAAEILREQTGAARAEAKPGEVRQALHILVAEYERIGDANARWAVASENLGTLAQLLADARSAHQQWLERIFERWLPNSPAARQRAIHALHVATDVYSWKLLRRDLQLSPAQTEETMLALIEGILRNDKRAGARERRA